MQLGVKPCYARNRIIMTSQNWDKNSSLKYYQVHVLWSNNKTNLSSLTEELFTLYNITMQFIYTCMQEN